MNLKKVRNTAISIAQHTVVGVVAGTNVSIFVATFPARCIVMAGDVASMALAEGGKTLIRSLETLRDTSPDMEIVHAPAGDDAHVVNA